MLTVKIDPKLRAQVKSLAADLGVSTSELVREALKQRLAQSKHPRPKSAYAATRDLCGIAEASDPGLSTRRMSVLLRVRSCNGCSATCRRCRRTRAMHRVSSATTASTPARIRTWPI